MSGKAVFAGSLDFISLADLFQILGGNSSSGVLTMNSQYAPNPGRIYFVDGNPINASIGALKGIIHSLDDRLRKITDRAVEMFMNGDNNKGFTKDKEVLIEKGSSQADLFTLMEGEAYIIGQNQKGDLPLLTLKEKDVFGNIPFIDIGHEPRSASVISSNDLRVNNLDIQSLREEYNNLSSTFKNLIYHLGNCISMTISLVYHFHKRK